MCFSKEASRNSFIISLISSFTLYSMSKNDSTFKILALFFGFVGLMQAYDWIFWENPEKNNINYIFTKIAMITNHLQPIILGLLIYFFTKKLSYNSIIILLIYTFVALIYSYKIFNKIQYTLVDDNNLLYWEWNYFTGYKLLYSLFLLSLSITVLENFKSPLNYILVFINLSSFFLATFKNHYIGKRWCEYASYVPLLLLLTKNYIR